MGALGTVANWGRKADVKIQSKLSKREDGTVNLIVVPFISKMFLLGPAIKALVFHLLSNRNSP